MAFPVLPPKYYLSHFNEFIEFLETHYGPVLEEAHRRFISDFRALSEDARCSYVRMVNRTGRVFARDGFHKYAEIENQEGTLDELIEAGFADSVRSGHAADLIDFLNKATLKGWLSRAEIKTGASVPRSKLAELALENLSILDIDQLEDLDRLVVQERTAEIEYLLFLYFGRIQKSLTLYALRDLGIRQAKTVTTAFKPRFTTIEDARADYFFARRMEEDLTSLDEAGLRALFDETESFDRIPVSAQRLKDALQLEIGEEALERGDLELGEKALLTSWHVSARERLARFFFAQDRKDECASLLEKIAADPRTDEELLFAEDFLERKFKKKRIGYLTEILKTAREITLPDSFLKRPEVGVGEYIKARGGEAEFTENYLWLSLFGLLFWEELFETEHAAIHNEFERGPSDLVGPGFYERNAAALEKKLALFENREELKRRLSQTIETRQGRLNDVFQWHPSLPESLSRFVGLTEEQDVAKILRAMTQKFEATHSGFPDLMVVENETVRFIEVKAEGDSLRANQLAKLRLLKESGFEVEVLRVKWEADPNQTYTVVDVETTGGSAGFHRITEVAAVKVRGGKVIDEFQTLINPGRPIPAFIVNLTGITDEMVSTAPPFLEIAPRLFEFLDGAIFVAHNVAFDYSFIQREFARVEMEFVRPKLCTCAGMRKAYPGLDSYGLKNLTEHFQIKLEQHHRALADARAATELLLLMNDKR